MFPEIQLCEAGVSKYEVRLVSVSQPGYFVSSVLRFRLHIAPGLNVLCTVDFDFQSRTSKLKQNELESIFYTAPES